MKEPQSPPPEVRIPEETLERWEARGIDRRDFLKFCTTMAATMALPMSFVPQIAAALDADDRPSVIWLEFQSCSGDTEALLRARAPSAADLILDYISLEYSEVVMAAAGHQAEEAKHQAMERHKGKYIAVVEGAVAAGDGGVYCTVAGESSLAIARKVCGNALATIAVGTCATYGGIPAAAPNPSGSISVKEAVPSATVINLPGCPLNAENLTATIVHFLTFGSLPATDRFGRPRFAYGKRIHDNCERRGHFDAGQYAETFGDRGHRDGWCLYKLGCKGPQTFHNCPTVRYNETSWPVMAGHGCIGCSEPHFWDTMTPFYRRLPQVPGFGIEATADRIGLGLAAATALAFGAHGVVSGFRKGDKHETKEVVKDEDIKVVKED
ncbi:hydrogenase small subunit [Geoalkalibacter halelectricus]|uniref:Hydrogenase small subunit n=1 Tax=Geoalkalibacter halelectricus TaxID=2847045 RepID=A0ABY5ZP67_9BACT|nr:hydrogenase small subunit [Geoalkalibacter halelectricus]MDO3378371.1 hydrogenase small subunit [Geoalkalibacter halelectricus]UWZ80309.1 hydrogenase small subunit [Geoalkalibacter halelectricus]